MTAKRAKLSLDPSQHSKAPPPHGFDAPARPAGTTEAGAAAPVGVSAGASAGAATGGSGAGRGTGRWRAHRPRPAEPSGIEAGGHAGRVAGGDGVAAVPMAAGQTGPLARAAAWSRHPAVRMVAVGVLTGLSLYLLRRRLF